MAIWSLTGEVLFLVLGRWIVVAADENAGLVDSCLAGRQRYRDERSKHGMSGVEAPVVY